MADQVAHEGEEWADEIDLIGGDDRDTHERILADARAGIEQHRKGDLTLRLVDGSGHAVSGLACELEQTGHAFDFGHSGCSTLAQEAADPGVAARNDLFVGLFNCTTAKCYWDEKWHQPIEHREGQRELGTFLAEIDWALSRGLKVRGHPLVWTVHKAVPEWAQRYPYDRQLRLVEENCRSLIAATQGRVKLWDLVNEALWEPSLRHLPERDWPHIEPLADMLEYIEPAVGWALDADPDGHYVINDYGLEVDFTELKGVTAAQQRRRFVALTEALIERGAAPGAVGTQAHVGKWFPMSAVQQTFDELSQPGLPVQVSEFWAHLSGCPNSELNDAAKAKARVRYVCDYYTVAFGHRAVEHLTYWGSIGDFAERGGYVPSAMYRGLDALINHAWRTQASLTSNSDGVISQRAFYGDYVLRWRDRRGRPHTRSLRLDPQAKATELVIQID